MKGWVKALIAIICIAAVAAAGFGIYSWIKADSSKKTDLCVDYNVEYVKDVQNKEQPLVFRAWAVGEEFTSIKYQIDTAEEVKVDTAVVEDADESFDNYDASKHDGLVYIDSGVISVDVSELEAGKHIFQIFVYNGDKCDCIMEKIFTIQ